MAGGGRLMMRRTPMLMIQGLVFRDWCGFVGTRVVKETPLKLVMVMRD